MKFRFVYTSLGLLFLAYLFMSSSSGRNGNWAGHPSDSGFCGTCHTSTGAGNVVLTGTPASYIAGTTYPLTLTINDAGAAVGGFQIVATNGTTNAQVGTFTPGAGTKLNNVSRLVQDASKVFSGGSVSWTFDWVAPSSGSTSPEVQFYYAGNAANGNGNNGAGDNGYSGNSVAFPLPVELTFFKAKTNDQASVKLTWQTASETNNDYFEIQRSSADNDDVFETIGRLEGAGDFIGKTDYDFLDENPHMNQVSYYRLKQVDLDDKFTFSPIQSVKISKEETFAVYPNPIRKGDKLNIRYSDFKNNDAWLRVINTNGQTVLETKMSTWGEAGNYDLPLRDVAKGTYFVAIYNQNNFLEMKRIIVQE